MTRQQAIEIAKTNDWQKSFEHLSRGRIKFSKKMRNASVGDELAARTAQVLSHNPKGHRWWVIGSYSRPGGGGYCCLRSDGKLVTLEQSTNLTKEFAKTELGQLTALVQEACEDVVPGS